MALQLGSVYLAVENLMSSSADGDAVKALCAVCTFLPPGSLCWLCRVGGWWRTAAQTCCQFSIFSSLCFCSCCLSLRQSSAGRSVGKRHQDPSLPVSHGAKMCSTFHCFPAHAALHWWVLIAYLHSFHPNPSVTYVKAEWYERLNRVF